MKKYINLFLIIISPTLTFAQTQNSNSKKGTNVIPIYKDTIIPYNPISNDKTVFFIPKKIELSLPPKTTYNDFVKNAIVDGGCIRPFPPRIKGGKSNYRLTRQIKNTSGQTINLDCTFPNLISIYPPKDNTTVPEETERFILKIKKEKKGSVKYKPNDFIILGTITNMKTALKPFIKDKFIPNAIMIELYAADKKTLLSQTITDSLGNYDFQHFPINSKTHPKNLWMKYKSIMVKFDFSSNQSILVPGPDLHNNNGCDFPILPTDKVTLQLLPEEDAPLCIRNRGCKLILTQPTINELDNNGSIVAFALIKKKNQINDDSIWDMYNSLQNEKTTMLFNNGQLIISTPVELSGGSGKIIITGNLILPHMFNPQDPDKQQSKRQTENNWDWSKGTIFDPFGPKPKE